MFSDKIQLRSHFCWPCMTHVDMIKKNESTNNIDRHKDRHAFLIAFALLSSSYFHSCHLLQWKEIYICEYMCGTRILEMSIYWCSSNRCVHKGCRHVVREMIDRCVAHHRMSTVHFSDYNFCAQWLCSSFFLLCSFAYTLLLVVWISRDSQIYFGQAQT